MGKRRIALYGGSFNPPTFGHVFAATYILKTGIVDDVRVCPTFKHPFDKPLLNFTDRLALCLVAFDGITGVTVTADEQFAFEEGGTGMTLDLVRSLRRFRYPRDQADLFLVLGSDILPDLPRWRGLNELMREVTPIFLGRSGFNPEPYLANAPPHAICLFDLWLPEVSSTIVRERCAAGQSISQLVPASVHRYIQKKGLYKAG